jgi:hypothetical protein
MRSRQVLEEAERLIDPRYAFVRALSSSFDQMAQRFDQGRNAAALRQSHLKNAFSRHDGAIEWRGESALMWVGVWMDGRLWRASMRTS